MTEAQWLTGTDRDAMLKRARDKAAYRKWRRFLCACCRRIWHLLPDERSRHAVEVAERHAGGVATAEALLAASEAAGKVARQASNVTTDQDAADAAYRAAFAP